MTHFSVSRKFFPCLWELGIVPKFGGRRCFFDTFLVLGESMRCFVAIPLPPTITGGLSDCCLGFQRHDSAVRWVRAENLHISLKFLGEVDPKKINEKFFEESTQLLAPFEPIPLSVRMLGQFPPKGIPRVFWAGVTGEGVQRLQEFSKTIEDFFERFGLPREGRPYHPHVTLARLKTKPSSGLLRVWKESTDRTFGDFIADCVTLFRSELTKGGAVYNVVREFPLVFSSKK